MAERMLILEFNELCPSLLGKFMAEGWLPSFERLYRGAEVHVTTTDDADLEPWVQWITFHCGVRESLHGVRELDQGHRVAYPAIWDRLAEEGRSCVAFGVMNAAPAKSPRVLLVPDPWSTHVPVPPGFEPYQAFVRKHVLGHTGKSGAVREAAAFLRFMASHGLSARSVRDLAAQLLHERAAGGDVRWRRVACLDDLQWDVFRHLWSERRPDFAAFFSNSTAFLQHRYWRHMEPQAYEVKPSDESVEAYGEAIRYGYRKMDRIVGDALAIAGPATAVVLATALSQQPNLRYEKIGGKFVYRPRDFRALLDLVGIPGEVSVEPVMTHQAWMTCRDEAEAARCREALLRLEMGGAPVMSAVRVDHRVYFDCRIISRVPDDALMSQGSRFLPFGAHFSFLGQVVNARHHPDGALWIRSPGGKHVVHQAKLELSEASSLLLATLGSRPARAERRQSQTAVPA